MAYDEVGSLNRNAIVQELVECGIFEPSDAKSFVDKFFEALQDGLVRDKELYLSGFGTFSVKEKKARPGRNPRTGEVHDIEGRNVVTFKIGSALKDSLITTA